MLTTRRLLPLWRQVSQGVVAFPFLAPRSSAASTVHVFFAALGFHSRDVEVAWLDLQLRPCVAGEIPHERECDACPLGQFGRQGDSACSRCSPGTLLALSLPAWMPTLFFPGCRSLRQCDPHDFVLGLRERHLCPRGRPDLVLRLRYRALLFAIGA